MLLLLSDIPSNCDRCFGISSLGYYVHKHIHIYMQQYTDAVVTFLMSLPQVTASLCREHHCQTILKKSIPDSTPLLHLKWCCSKCPPHQLPCLCHCTHHRRPTCPQGNIGQPRPGNCPPHSMRCSGQEDQMGSSDYEHPQCHCYSWRQSERSKQK